MIGLLLLLVFLGVLGLGFWKSLHVTQTKGTYDQTLTTWSFRALSGAPFFAGAFAVLALALSVATVDAGTRGVVLRFGNPVRELSPGVHLVIPFAETVTPVIVQTQIVKPSEEAASHDLQVVKFQVTFAYHVDPRYATYVLVNLNDDAENRIIKPAILEAIKAVTAQYDVQQLIEQRATVRNSIETLVTARIAPYHIVAETTSITDFSFSKDFESAIEAKVTAQQLAEKAKNDLTRIQIQAQQQIAQAQGEAEALKLQKEQITPELLQLRAIEMMRAKWNGELPNVMIGGNGVLPMVDVLKAASQARK